MTDGAGGQDASRSRGVRLERRDFLRKAAVVGTGAFAVPMIITVDPAEARALTSPPPQPPNKPKPPGGPPSTTPGKPGTPPGPPTSRPGPGGPRPPVSPPSTRPGGLDELPRTGADLDRMAAAGLAATAGGAALVLWSADKASS